MTDENMHFRHLDSTGLFCRNIDLLSNIAAAWMNLPSSKALSQKADVVRLACGMAIVVRVAESGQKPNTILYPWPSFPHINPEVTEVVDEFLKSMEAFAKRSRREIDFSEEWEKSGYKDSNVPLTKLFQNVGFTESRVLSLLAKWNTKRPPHIFI
jgi:hypothetical protein